MALLPRGAPLGLVAILGVLALIGILIRNSVILIVQIEHLKKEGRPAWEAVVEATEHRPGRVGHESFDQLQDPRGAVAPWTKTNEVI